MVDYTLTPNKSLIKPNRGTYVDQWDEPINSDWDYVDRALGGTFTVVATTGTIALSNDQARYQQIKLPNTTEVRTIEIPLIEGSSTVAVGGFWIIDNAASAQDIYVTTLAPGTNTITVKAGKRQSIFSNGTGVFFADDSRIIAGTGLTLVGNTLSLEVPVEPENGGTGYTTYTNGQLLIGKADGTLAKATLTAGTNVTITNGDGTITIAASGGSSTGGLSSISLGSSLSGVSFSPSTLNSTTTSTTLQGTLGTANGGTGTSLFPVNPGFVRVVGTSLTSVATVDLNALSGQVTGTLSTANGGTGTTSTTGTGSVVFSTNPIFTGTAQFAALTATGNISTTGTGTITSAGNLTGSNLILSASSNTIGFKNDSSNYYISVSGSGASTTLGLYLTTPIYSCTPSVMQIYVQPQANQTNFTLISDERTKKNITPYDKSLNDVVTLSPVTYQYNGAYGTKDDGITRVGLIAQDVLDSSMPEMVGTYVYTDPATGQKTDLYNLNPSDLMFAFINSIKALEARVKELEAKVGP